MRAAAGPAYITPRILFLELLLRTLYGKPTDELIGLLKTALETPEAATEWTIEPVLEHFHARLAPGPLDLLTALSKAPNNPAGLAGLEAFEQWWNSPQVPLDTPWPQD